MIVPSGRSDWTLGARPVRCTNSNRARTIPRRRCGSNQAPQRHLGLPGTCPSRGQIPKPTKRKTARNASKQTPPTHPRTTSPKEVARAALAPNSKALPGAARCRRAAREGQPVVGVELPNGPLRRAYEASAPSIRARAAQLPLRLSSASSAAAARRRELAFGQPQPWRRRRPRPSMTASPSSGSA